MKDSAMVAIDIGSNKISISIGEEANQDIDIRKSFSSPSKGIGKGKIQDEQKLLESIQGAFEKVRRNENLLSDGVYLGISSRDVFLREISSSVNLREGRVKVSDIRRAIEKGKRQILLKEDEEILDVYINFISIDNKICSGNVIGWLGNIICLDLSIMICKKSEIEIYRRIFSKIGVKILGCTLSSVSTRKVFLDEKKSLGSKVLIDIGAGTSDIAIYNNGVIKEITSISTAGNNITNDISICGKYSFSEAESIKKFYSKSYERLHKEEMEVSIGDLQVSTELLYQVVNARIEELLENVNMKLKNSLFQEGICSIILYGDGISFYENIDMIAKEKLDWKVRVHKSEMYNLQNFSNIASISIIKDMYDRKTIIRETEEYKEEFVEEIEVDKSNLSILEKIKILLGEIF